eukprot:TRINITY_DN16829_c0_g1_i2.p1 TRINITY_DN16829_c0_g1~~TRINITY_DN16829_c0_g1_i2.p1  ORF type:complete len:103 (+),score=23.03 TRINITY_DN16829_c0_g1_i2:97-405(+)
MLSARKKAVLRERQGAIEPLDELLKRLKESKGEDEFVKANFACLLEICKKHVETLDEMAQKYTNSIDIKPEELTHFKGEQEKRHSEIMSRLEYIVKNVLSLI